MASEKTLVPSVNLEPGQLLTQVVNFGNALLEPPASDTELLQLLDELQLCLSGIHQGEAEKFLSSLGPSKEALIGNQLLRHANTDVQISVLSCINEITRITAPEWPYEHCKMKEFLLLLVQSLKSFSSMNVHCYTKAASILETVAGIKSCVIMLDLNMDGPILEMFQNFLFSIQLRPTFDVFSDMVTIMTTLMEELKEEGIPVDLLNTLLTSVKVDKKDGSPISWAMGVKILQSSAEHVRPSLTKLVQSLEINLNDYAEIVASICQDAAQVENTMRQELADSVAPNGQLVDGLSKSLENNFTSRDMDNGISCEQSNLKIPQFGNQMIELTLTENVAVERDDRPSKDENSPKDLNSGPSKEKNTANLKTISEVENGTMIVLEVHNHGALDMDQSIFSEENVSKTLQFDNHTLKPPLTGNVSRKSGVVSPLKDDNSLKEQTSGGMAIQQISTDVETISLADNVNLNNDVPQDNSDGIKVPEKRERKLNSLFKLEEGYLFAGRFGQIGFPESSCGWKNHKRRTNWSSDRKSNSVLLGNKSFGDEKPCRKRTMKKISQIVNQHDWKRKQLSSRSLSVCGKRSTDKSTSSANCDQEFNVVLASLFSTKPTPESEYKGKSSVSKEQASRMTYGEKLVGCKIKVWWPLDQAYYEGSVDSFDLITMTHKVIYDDGDEEILNLMGEDWELVKASALLDDLEKIQVPASSDPNISDGPSSKKQKIKSLFCLVNSEEEDIPQAARASME